MGRLYGSNQVNKNISSSGGRLFQSAPHLFQYNKEEEFKKLNQQRDLLAKQEAQQARVAQQAAAPQQNSFLSKPFWKQIFSPETIREIPSTITSAGGRLINAVKKLRDPEELLKKASFVAGGTIETAKNLTIPYAEKRYTSAVNQNNALTDQLLSRYRSEQDPQKKLQLRGLLEKQVNNAPKALDFSTSLNKTSKQIAADTAMAGLEWILPFVGGAAAEGATKAAPLLTRSLGDVVKSGVAKLATKEGLAAVAKPIATEAGYGALYGGLGALQQGETKAGKIAKESAKMAAIAPVLAGVLKLGARGASEVLTNIDKNIVQKPLRSITFDDLKSITRAIDESAAKSEKAAVVPPLEKAVPGEPPKLAEIPATEPKKIELRQANRPLNEANTRAVVTDTLAGKREDLRLDKPKAHKCHARYNYSSLPRR